MITTDFKFGSPCWIEVTSPDTEASAAFYRELFGWEAGAEGPGSGGYRILLSDGAVAGGLLPLWGESDRPDWMVYFAAPDVEETLRSVESLGGTLVVEPFDVGGIGRTSQFLDPQGAPFGIWQAPSSHPGLEAVDRPNSLCWVELWTPDGEGAREFYTKLFRWDLNEIDVPGQDGTYTVIAPEGMGRERAHGGFMAIDSAHLAETEGSGDWHPVFAVADCDAAVEKVRAAGGHVYMGPESTPGVGRLAVCSDPFRAGFVLLTPSPE